MTPYIAYFEQGNAKSARPTVGIEYELLGVREESGRAIVFEGERSLSAVFGNLLETGRFLPVREGKRVIELTGDGYRVTLEPGCQAEFSGGVHSTLAALERQLLGWLAALRAASAPLGIAWLPLGVQPATPLREMDLIPKERYAIMARYLPTRGDLAPVMMRQTGGFQVGVGYASLEDAAAKYAAAALASTFVSAAFAASPVHEGAPCGYESFRMEAWARCDSDRCLFFERAFSTDFSVEDYVNYVLDVPMFFIKRGGRMVPVEGKITFRQFAEKGWGEFREEEGDWDLHVSTPFPEVRLRRGYVEVRAMDAAPPAAALAGAAFWRGLLDDKHARKAVRAIVPAGTLAERIAFHREVARLGLATEWKGRTALFVARDLLRAAREGLARVAPNETAYLMPLERILASGESSSRRILAAWKLGGAGEVVRRWGM